MGTAQAKPSAASNIEAPSATHGTVPVAPPQQKGSTSTAESKPAISVDDMTTPSPSLKKSDFDEHEYEKFRTELFAFSLGEASFDYAQRMYDSHPNNPQVMALFAETALLYERMKNPGKRDHWIDRQNLLTRGIEATRKCMREYPDYAPCATNYTLLAVKAAEGQFYWRWLQPIGLMSYYKVIDEQGRKAVELGSQSAPLHKAMGELYARCAPGPWYSFYHLPRLAYGLPSKRKLLELARDEHLKAHELNPKDLENACRLGMTYYQLGDLNESRRWYVRVRDEMIAVEPKDEIWQGVAHTSLCTHFERTKWNTPFG